MKSKLAILAIVLAGLPAIAWGQAPCGCGSKGHVRPASYGTWADYQPVGHSDGCGCNSCTSRAPSCGSPCNTGCCTPCCGRQLLCIIPNTVRKIGSVLDCILPCGPRTCNSCVSCTSPSCTGGCPSCSSPAGMGNPFQDDEPLPSPPKPKVQETRRQPTIRAPREYAASPAPANRYASSPGSTRPATKSVLTRAPKMAEEEVSQANLSVTVVKRPNSSIKRTSATAPISESSSSQSSRRSAAIPVNPLR
ncbi:MAG: hypothetical protein ACKVP0_04720 [Pirellulaceae bacterium]